MIDLAHRAYHLRDVVNKHLMRVKERPDVVEDCSDEGALEQCAPDGDGLQALCAEKGVDKVGGQGDVDEVSSAVLLQGHVEEGEGEQDDADYLAVDRE